MPPLKYLIFAALFFSFGTMAMVSEAGPARLHWAALAIITFGVQGLLIIWDGNKAGQLHFWGAVIHQHNQPQTFRAATRLGAAGGIACLGIGLWVLGM